MGEWKIGLKESLIDIFCETQNSLSDIRYWKNTIFSYNIYILWKIENSKWADKVPKLLEGRGPKQTWLRTLVWLS
jgi:hypothetical protein